MGAVISVIVPTRDCETVIGPCLAALAAQTLPAAEVIVVDDASSDRTVAAVREGFPNARLIVLAERSGFTGACLTGYEAARGDWIAVLNADTEPDPGWLAEAVGAAGDDERVGMIASKVVLAEPEGMVDSLGLMVKASGLAHLRGHGELEGGVEDTEVFGPAGSAALYRRSALAETGFFEADYFLYYEDVDLAFRLRWLGYSCRLAGKARVVHRHSHVTGREPREKRYYLQRNRLRTIARNWPALALIIHSPWIALHDAASLALAVAEGSGRAAITARLDFLGRLDLDLAARRSTLSRAKTTRAEMRSWIGK